MKCNSCPRQCNIDRDSAVGFCGVSGKIRVARAALHFWEEPCISGTEGSGAVFFSGCNLQCIFCQNREISRGKVGKDISCSRLAEIFVELQKQGANNINLVTPSHYVNQIIPAIIFSREMGLSVPVVYNSSAYESVETLKKLEGYIDVYLPDCKYWDEELAVKFSRAPAYRDISFAAIGEMLRQTGKAEFDENGLIKKGVIVRHLVLPGHVNDSKKVIGQLYDTFGDDIYISIMNQYTPLADLPDYPELNRKLTGREYKKILDYALDIGIENGFMQEGDVAKESFVPSFDLEGV